MIRSLNFASIVTPKQIPVFEEVLAKNGYGPVGSYGNRHAYEPIDSEPSPTVQYHDLEVLENIEEQYGSLPKGTGIVPSSLVTRK